MRTKMLAATILVAGALSMSGGALVLSQADAQSGGGSSGGPPAGSPPSSGGFSPGAAPGGGNNPFGPGVGPGGFGGDNGGGVGFFGGQRGGGTGGSGGMSISGGPAWEYKFVDIDGDRKEYERLITQNGKDGWEFCESNRMNDGKRDVLVLVFKKPRGGRLTLGGGAMGGMGMIGGGGGGLGGMPGASGGGMAMSGPGGGTGFGGFDPPMPGLGGSGARFTAGDIEARTHRLKTTNATDLARVIEKSLPNAKTLKVVPETNSNMIIIVADTATMKEVLRDRRRARRARRLLQVVDPAPGRTPGAGGSGGGTRPPPGAGGAPGRPGQAREVLAATPRADRRGPRPVGQAASAQCSGALLRNRRGNSRSSC